MYKPNGFLNCRRFSSVLMREFINDSLYNAKHGYFSKNVNIFNSSEQIIFNQLKDQDDYSKILNKMYIDCERGIASTGDQDRDQYRKERANKERTREHTKYTAERRFNQLWHTPSELFKPFYGRAIVNFLLESKEDLVIYEIGPGNGTLAENILNVLKEQNPQIYERTEYNLIEITDQLVRKQAKRLNPIHEARVRFPKVEILNMPEGFIEERPCWILGMEVLDNLAHDLIKFRNEDGAVMEAVVNIDEKATYGSIPGKYWKEFQVARDPLILEYVQMGDELGWKWASLRGNPWRRTLERFSPFDYINPWSCEYIPTSSLKLLKSLAKHFPKHRALFSDFDELPDTVDGHNGPVVQTRFRGMTVPCSTVLLKPGLFDIFFPTNFHRLSQLHAKITSNTACVEKHADFLKKWADPCDLKETTTKSGYNPMIQDFENVSFYYNNKPL